MIEQLFSWSQEYRGWGWNALTVSFIGTIVSTILQIGGLLAQRATIRRLQSGASVAALWHAFNAWMFIAFALYGILALQSIALTMNGCVLATGHALVLLALRATNAIDATSRRVLMAGWVMPVMLAILPWKAAAVLTISFVSFIPFASQPWAIWRAQDAGAVDVRLAIAYVVATTFWVIYYVMVGDVPFIIICSIALVILMSMIALWWRYRARNE